MSFSLYLLVLLHLNGRSQWDVHRGEVTSGQMITSPLRVRWVKEKWFYPGAERMEQHCGDAGGGEESMCAILGTGLVHA